MPDFNAAEPPKRITNPTGLPVGDFPRHVHKFAGLDEDGAPKLNHYRVVHSLEEQEAALAEGWSLTPQLKAPPKVKKD